MTDLSPATQAVLNAFLRAPFDNRLSVAAALRSVADQVVPKNRFGPPENAAAAQREITREDILAIATELEGAVG